MATIGVVLVLLAQISGLSFSMAVLPEPFADSVEHVDALVAAGTLESEEGRAISLELMRNEAMRVELSSRRLDSAERLRLTERVRPEDQRLVLGLGGLSSFAPPFAALLIAALATMILVRLRRPTELALGAAVAVVAQLGVWLFVAGFDVAALLGGELHMVHGSFGFAGAPIMLLAMWAVLGVGAVAGGSYVMHPVLEQVTGVAVCDGCEHRFATRPKAPEACPRCHARRVAAAGVRWRGGADVLAELGPAQQGTTLASSGATELLCLRCAKAYPSDRCPHHPHEPLLDPRLDAVRFQLLELDASAGTRRFSQWTADGLGIDASGPSRPRGTGPLLCMACARTIAGDQCSVHPEEPLLDPSREEVRLELIAADDRRRARVSIALMFGSALLAAIGSIGLGWMLGLDVSTGLYVFAGLLVALITASQLATPALAPPRYAAWTGESAVDLDEVGMGARATILAPLRRALTRAREEVVPLVLATVAGAGLGVGVAVAFDGPIGAFAVVGGFALLVVALIVVTVIDTLRVAKGAVREVREAWNDPYGVKTDDTP